MKLVLCQNVPNHNPYLTNPNSYNQMKLPFKKETEQQKKTRVANEIKLYEKKSRAWLESEPKNWTSAILRGWYKARPHLIED